MKIVFASHTYIGGPFVVGSHHLAHHTAKLGHDVLHLATPITPVHVAWPRGDNGKMRRAAWARGPRPFQSGVKQIVPLSFARGRAGRVNLTLASTMPPLRRQFTRAEFRNVDILIIDQPFFAGLWDYIDARVTIYRPTDVYPSMLGKPRIADDERQILSRSHGAVCTSQPVIDHIRPLAPADLPIHLMENGVDFAFFSTPAAPPADLPATAKKRVVYTGALDDRFDWEAVRTAAEALPEVEFILIGPAHGFAENLAMPANVRLLGRRPYEQLPAYLQHADLAILPMNNHPGNAGRSPMKLYEYAAAGLMVVARKTDELARRKSSFVALYDSNSEFVAFVRKAIAMPPQRDDITRQAMQYDWAAKTRDLLAFASSVTSSSSNSQGQLAGKIDVSATSYV